MDTFVTFYNAVPPFVWAFIFGAPAIVLTVNVCKKLFGVNSTLVIHSLNVTIGFILANGAEYLSHNPKPLIFNAAVTSALFTTANFLYAASKKLAPFFTAVENYEARKARTAAADAPAPAPSVSSTSNTTMSYSTTGSGVITTPTTVTIPVSDGTVFEG